VDVSAQILQSAAGGSTRIRIQYNTFLSYSHLDAYLQKLKEGGLLEHVDTLNTFRTTEAGYRFLKLYSQIVECIDPEQFGISATSR
jgi:predicted transcriptional regulator